MRESMKMKVVASLLILIHLVPVLTARHISRPVSYHGHLHSMRSKGKDEHAAAAAQPSFYWQRHRRPPRQAWRGVADTVQIAGSTLPDCSHACGSCSPCRLVMVSFVCAAVQEAETCPMAYKCMCNKKSYPVP